MSAIETAQQPICGDCREPVEFVEGLHGPERWKHLRTGDWRCHPICKQCGAPASIKIGCYNMDGGQIPFFDISHWECVACAAKTCRIDYVR